MFFNVLCIECEWETTAVDKMAAERIARKHPHDNIIMSRANSGSRELLACSALASNALYKD